MTYIDMKKGWKLIPLLLLVAIVLTGFLVLDTNNPTTYAQSPASISGYAWSDNIGWISFSGSNYGFSVAEDGVISGYAWSDNIGWISANSSDLEACPSLPCEASIDTDGNLQGWLKTLSGDSTIPVEINTDIVWTAGTAAGNNDSWKSIAYGNGIYVVVGGQLFSTSDRLMTSTDGVNWTVRSVAGNNDQWHSVAYGNGTFVAVGCGTECSNGSTGPNGDYIMTSTNGINWTVRAGPKRAWSSITYANGKFVAVAGCYHTSTDCTGLVMTSTDGITWSTHSVAGDDDEWSSVTYGDGLFVAVGSCVGGDHCAMTSPDGITWTTRTVPSNAWRSVTYGNGLFVAVDYQGQYPQRPVMTSPDGITWTGRSVSSNNTRAWLSVKYNDGLFVAVGAWYGTDRVMVSTDGITWTGSVGTNSSNWWSDLIFVNDRYVAVGYSGSNRVMVSESDGDEGPLLNGWDGFISLSGSNYGPVRQSDGNFVGYAWGSEIIGWLDFNYASTDYMAEPNAELKVRKVGEEEWQDSLVIEMLEEIELGWNQTSTSNTESCEAVPPTNGFSTNSEPSGIDSDVQEPIGNTSISYSLLCYDSDSAQKLDTVTVSTNGGEGANFCNELKYVRRGTDISLCYELGTNEPALCSIRAGGNTVASPLSGISGTVDYDNIIGEVTFTLECIGGDSDTMNVKVLPDVQET